MRKVSIFKIQFSNSTFSIPFSNVLLFWQITILKQNTNLLFIWLSGRIKHEKERDCGHHFSLKPAALVLKCKLDQNQYKPWGFNLYTKRTSLFWKSIFFLNFGGNWHICLIWSFADPVSQEDRELSLLYWWEN